jgi:hypothetical protein
MRTRERFTNFCRLYGVEPAPHHRLIINRLVRVSRGEFNRLAIFMPPGSAKSTYGSILFPAWYLGQHPTHSILAASHTTELAEKWGRRVRNLLNEHGLVLKLSVSEDNAAAGRWSVKQGGEYYSAGVGVGIAGFRADLQEAFLQDFLEAWLAFGRPALMAAAWTKPAEFVKVAASLMPKEVDQTITTINMDRMTDEQLAAIAFGSSGPPLEEAEDEGAVH